MGYSDCTQRSIRSLTELRPGDHIRVPGSRSSGFDIKSSSSSSYGYQNCEGKLITHHLLVVEAIDDTHVKVIHKTKEEDIKQQTLRYRPRHVTVLDYESWYMGKEAVQRAREIMRTQEQYKLVTQNCEHFVTEVRTGKKQSSQVQGAVSVAVGGGVGGAVVGGAVVGGAAGAGTGALIGAGIGSVIPVAGTLVGAGVGAIIGGVAGGGGIGLSGVFGGIPIGIKLANWLKKG